MSAWPSIRLDAVAKVVRGVTYAKGDVVQAPANGDIPILRAGNINGHLILDHDLVWLAKNSIGKDQFLQRNDIVMCMSSGSASIVGKSALLNRDWVGSFGAFCAAVRANEAKADPGYLAHVFQSAGFRKWASAAQGNNIKNLNKSALEGYALPIPPLEEQRRIVGLLDRAAEIRRRADAARAKARAIIPALFLDLFGDPATLTERCGGASFDDLVGSKLLGLVRSTREQPENGAVGYVRMNAITSDGRVVLDDLRRTDVTGNEATSHELRPGDLLFNTRNSYELVGKMGLYAGPPGNVFNNNIMRVRFNDRVLAAFVNAYFQTAAGQASITSIKKGTTSVCAIYYKDLAKVEIPLPPLPLQTAFAEQAQRLEAAARALDTAAAKAEAMAAALSAQVFGGAPTNGGGNGA